MNKVDERDVAALGAERILAAAQADESGSNGKLVGEAQIPDPEVSALPKRRRFTAAFKAQVVEEAERCTQSGEIGALLRREGLYSSQLSEWRKLYRAGALQSLRDDKRGRKKTKNPLTDEVAQLRKTNARLSHRLEHAEAIIEIQKKVASMLGVPLNSIENENGE